MKRGSSCSRPIRDSHTPAYACVRNYVCVCVCVCACVRMVVFASEEVALVPDLLGIAIQLFMCV